MISKPPDNERLGVISNPDHWAYSHATGDPVCYRISKSEAKELQDIALELRGARPIVSAFNKAVAGVMWMHKDDTLKLVVGNDLLVEGVESLRKQRNELRAEVSRLRAALEPLVDDEVCRLDHHGNCQTHSLGNPCEMVAARKALKREPTT